MSNKAIKIFISYSHKDEAYKDELLIHLVMLQRNGLIDGWNDRQLIPGQEWDDEIKAALEECEVLLFLVSPRFLASNYIFNVEIKEAMKRYENKEVVIIPILIKPCDFESSTLNRFQALPKNAQPISKWEDQDEAFFNVISELKKVIQNIDVLLPNRKK